VVCGSCWDTALLDVLQWEWARVCKSCAAATQEEAPAPLITEGVPPLQAITSSDEEEWAILSSGSMGSGSTVSGSSDPEVGVRRLPELGLVAVAHKPWVEDGPRCMVPACGLPFVATRPARRRHHCRHCGLLVCTMCWCAEVHCTSTAVQPSQPGWTRVCIDCAVGMAEAAVAAPDADIEGIAAAVHELSLTLTQARADERAREEASLLNTARRNVQVVLEQRAEQRAAMWSEDGLNTAAVKATTKPCVKCSVPIGRIPRTAQMLWHALWPACQLHMRPVYLAVGVCLVG
jgi:hypothetical protein